MKSGRWLTAALLLFAACGLVGGAWYRLTRPLMVNSPRLDVFKAKRELRLYDGERLVKTYRVALGGSPIGTKRQEGDGATPEGRYYVCVRNPQSRFHLSLGISYPGPADAESGWRTGLIDEEERRRILQAAADQNTPPWKTRLGGEVFIHGGGAQKDWTAGCIALEDRDIEELYRLVPLETAVVIYP